MEECSFVLKLALACFPCWQCLHIVLEGFVISGIFFEKEGHKNRGSFAQKTSQPAGIFSLVEISCILTENDCPDFFLRTNNKNSLSLTSFPLVGFSRAIGQNFLSTMLSESVFILFSVMKN